MNPAAVLSAQVKVQGITSSLSQLKQFDNAARKAAGGADVATTATDKHSRAQTIASKTTKGLALVTGGALVMAVRAGISEMSESAKITAQTNAVLKSTGGIAKVSAKDVDTLASSLMKKSGVDDETIASGENMLLTFTRIRNEVGKGNDIFNQATKATLDMSVAMGKDMTSTSIMVGKALQDPIRGVTALRKVGVALSTDQQKLIKSMVESGNTMGAQKIILKELNTEFGGSAEAAGKTLPGQLSKLKETFNNVAGAVLTTAVPAFSAVLKPLQAMTDFFSAHPKLAAIMIPALAGVTLGIWALNAALSANPFVLIAIAITAFIAGLVVAYVKVKWFRDMVNAAWDWIKTAAQAAWPVIVAVVSGAFNTIKDLWNNVLHPVFDAIVWFLKNVLIPAWKAGWELVKGIVSGVWTAISGVVRGALDIIRGIINIFAGLFTGDFDRMWTGVKQIFSGALTAVTGVVRGAWGALRAAGTFIMEGLHAGINAVWGTIKNLVGDIVGGIIGTIKGAWNSMWSAGRDLLGAIWSGMKSVAQWTIDRVLDFIRGVVRVINTPLGWVGAPQIPEPGAVKLAKGGMISAETLATGGTVLRPMAVIGEQAPTHPEYVIPTNPAYRSRAMGLFSSLGNQLGVPGYQFGGILDFAGSIAKTVASNIIPAPLQAALDMGGGAVAKSLINMLPGIPGLPDSLGALPKYALNKIVDWLKKTIGGSIEKAGGGPVVARMVAAMNRIAAQHFPYVYGGGHNPTFSGPYDCSGLVSAILHAGGFISSPMATDGLKVWGQPGTGSAFTVGVRGTSGMGAHTMMRLGHRFLESGSGHGAQWVEGWSGSFPIMRHAPGYQRGGILDLWNSMFGRDMGWGLASGGILPPFGGSFGDGGIVPGPAGAARTIIAHGGEPVGSGMGNVIVQGNLVVKEDADVQKLASQLAWKMQNS